jgi:hypothetical protein
MARKSTEAAKAKAAREKKILVVLSGVLVLALAYGLYTMHGLGGNKAAAATATPPLAATTTTAAATPAPGTSAAPPIAGVATAADTAAPSADAPLVAAVQPPVGTGQLESFSRFDSKDPFDADGPKSPSSSPSSAAPSAAPSAAAKSTAGAAPGGDTTATTAVPSTTSPTLTLPALPALPPPTAAVIAVNGAAASVSADADFPVSADPVENGIFHLVGLTQTTAQVTIVGGSYAGGSQVLTLKENEPVTLVNTADGKRYTLELLPQGTAAPAAAPTSTTPSTTG